MLPMNYIIVMVVSGHSAPMAILGTGQEAKMTTILPHEAPVNEQRKHAMILAVTLTTIPVETQSRVGVIMSECDFWQ